METRTATPFTDELMRWHPVDVHRSFRNGRGPEWSRWFVRSIEHDSSVVLESADRAEVMVLNEEQLQDYARLVRR